MTDDKPIQPDPEDPDASDAEEAQPGEDDAATSPVAPEPDE